MTPTDEGVENVGRVIEAGTPVHGKPAPFLHGRENGMVEEIQERGRVAVDWDTGYSNYTICSFIGYLREGYVEVVDEAIRQ